MKHRLLSTTLLLSLTFSIGCPGRRVVTDPTQTGDSIAVKFEKAANRAERVVEYAQLAHDKALPIFAGIVKMTGERLARDQALLLQLRDHARAAAPIFRGIANATMLDGKERAKALIDQMVEAVKELQESGVFVFPETEAGQRLESVVRVALALLPEAIGLLKDALQ